MKKTLRPLLLLLSIIMLSACNHFKEKRALEVLDKFETAYLEENISAIQEVYPNFVELKGNFLKLDDLVCIETHIDGNNIVVKGQWNWTNSLGKLFKTPVTFYLTQIVTKGEKNYIIRDTKNLVNFDDDPVYLYAKVNGKITNATTKDLEKSKIVEKSRSEYRADVKELRESILPYLSEIGFQWEKPYYSSYATGACSIRNGSGFPVKNLRYQIIYMDSRGRTVGTDDGTVAYGWFYPGETKRIDWMTGNLPDSAERARIELILDPSDDWINEIMFSM